MKYLVMLMLGLLVAGSVSAQRYYPRRGYARRRTQRNQPAADHRDFYKPKFGIVGGLNFANVFDPNDPTVVTNTKLGFHAGASLDLPIAYPFAFEGEVIYSQKGYQANTNYGSFTQANNFIDVPLLLKIQVARGFHFVVGPQISFLTSTTNTFTSGFNPLVQQQFNQDSQGYNKTLVSGVFGLSFDLNRNWELRARYTVDLQGSPNYESGYNPQYNNQVWQIGLGYKF